MDKTTTVKEALLLREDNEGVATLALNRPDKYNPLSSEMLTAMQHELDSIAVDPNVRVVVLTAEGKAFCAGHDFKEMRAHPEKDFYDALFQQCSRMMMSLIQLPQPVIAKINGIATAAGCQLVGVCDLAVAADTARFATSGVRFGLFCSTPSVSVSRNLSRKEAMEILLTGEFISAAEAERKGLINRTVPADELDAVVKEYTDAIVAKSAVAISMGKEMFYKQIEMGMQEAYAFTGEVMARNMMADDAQEGFSAFLEKRQPVWKHK
ncbi:MAG: enoyl-CoA hydratase [Opitutaceae bacterium]|nr:enoyl-CoA hydratase [Opitutaceae bacterium]